jgi:hypothetical protein
MCLEKLKRHIFWNRESINYIPEQGNLKCLKIGSYPFSFLMFSFYLRLQLLSLFPNK